VLTRVGKTPAREGLNKELRVDIRH
jgi:hypothetical protein